MKQIVLATALLATGSISAFAADLSIKAPPVATTPVYNWSGFYAGLNAGFSGSTDSGVQYSQPYASPLVPLSSSGLLIGGQAGYNWQSGNTVFGIETDIQYRNASDRSQFVFPGPPGTIFGSVSGDTTYFRSEQNWFGTLRGRLGLSTGPVLYYATGGLAYGEAKHFYGEGASPYDDINRSVSSRSIKMGWTAGAGAEMKLWGNWSVGMEYLYVDLGKTTLNMPAEAIDIPPFVPTPFPASSASFDNISHIFRVKLNYAFNGVD